MDRVVIAGEGLLLEACLQTNQALILNVYGRPGTSCRVESSLSLGEASWQIEQQTVLTNRMWRLERAPDPAACRFFRALKP